MPSKFILITGSLGLIGFESVKMFLEKGYQIIGIDNNLRAKIFKIKTNCQDKLRWLQNHYKETYFHFSDDISNLSLLRKIFLKHKNSIFAIIHTAAQTSHDYSAKNPNLDYKINALATFKLLELTRKYSPQAIFIFTSTNKVYGDRTNYLNLYEFKTRYDLKKNDKYYLGINENFSVDQSLHSPFGVSKASADLLVQEYGRYFNLKTGVFRLGVVAGSGQNGTMEQGFLSYLIKKIIKDDKVAIIGYQGKQVRDVIHAKDVVLAFTEFLKKPKRGEVYNIGGGRRNAISIIELFKSLEKNLKIKINFYYQKKARLGDHKWWITDYSKFKKDYPNWQITFSWQKIVEEIINTFKSNVF